MDDSETEMREKLESRIDKLHNAQMDLIASLQVQVPDIVSSIDLSLRVISSYGGKPYTPLAKTPLPIPTKPTKISKTQFKSVERLKNEVVSQSSGVKQESLKNLGKSNDVSNVGDGEKLNLDRNGNGSGSGSRSSLSIVRYMVAGCLLERVPFTPIDSSTVLMKLENNVSGSNAEKVALRELGGDSGGIVGVEMALRSIADENGGVELEEFVVSGKSRVMVVEIDRGRLVKELPEGKQVVKSEGNLNQGQQAGVIGGGGGEFNNSGMFGMGGPMGRTMPDAWMGSGDPHFPGMPPMFPGGGGPGAMMGPRGGPRGMLGMMGVPPMHRPPMGLNGQFGGPSPTSMKPRSEEDDLKDLEALLNKKSFKEMQKSKTGEELLDLIHRPTAKETAVAAKVC